MKLSIKKSSKQDICLHYAHKRVRERERTDSEYTFSSKNKIVSEKIASYFYFEFLSRASG